MSNGFTCVRGCIRHPDGYVVASVNGSGTAEGAKATELLTAAFNASTTLATMGYDALECQKALPKLVRTIQIIANGLDEATASEYENRAVDMRDMARDALTRLRVQEVDNG